MIDQPLVQVSTPIRNGENPQVVVRVNGPDDIEYAESMLNEVAARIAPLVLSTARALADVPPETATAVAHLAQAGMSPTVVPPTPAPTVAPQATTQCPACSKSTACPQCQGPTTHTTKYSQGKGQAFNVHQCRANNRHTVTWCRTPIPRELQAIVNEPTLVYS